MRPSVFREFLRGLPDAVERARERGQPLVLPDPGTEHGRALYRTLGVEIEPETVGAARSGGSAASESLASRRRRTPGRRE